MNILARITTRAGGVPAVIGELLRHDLLPHPDALTVNGASIAENCRDAAITNSDVIFSALSPMKAEAGFINLGGNLFDSAIMKTSVISPAFAHAICQMMLTRTPLKAPPLSLTGRSIFMSGSMMTPSAWMKTPFW